MTKLVPVHYPADHTFTFQDTTTETLVSHLLREKPRDAKYTLWIDDELFVVLNNARIHSGELIELDFVEEWKAQTRVRK